MNIVGNQLISVYCTTFMAISTQEPNITRFSNTPVSKAEYGTACGALPSSAITTGGKGLPVWRMTPSSILRMTFSAS